MKKDLTLQHRPIRIAPGILGVALSVFVTDCLSPKAADEMTVTDYEAKSYDNIYYPELESEPAAVNPVSPVDERALWRLLSKKKYSELKTLIDRYQRQYPDWTPPSDLLAGLIRAEISEAKDNEDWPAIIALHRDYPNAFACGEISNQWTLADAYSATGRSSAVNELYAGLITRCANAEHRLVTLQRASQQLGRNQSENLLALEKSRPHSVDEQTALNNFEYTFYTGWLAQAWEEKNDVQMESALAPIADKITQRKDARTASLLGWWEMRRLNPTKAKDWFAQSLSWEQNNDTAYGLALALRDSNEPDQARVIVKNWQERDRRFLSLFPKRTVAGSTNYAPKLSADEIALEKANRAYKQGNYEQAATIAASTLAQPTKQRNESVARSLGLVEAWSLYHQFQLEAAEDKFVELYQAQEDIESAKGVVFSAIENKHFRRVLDVGRVDCGPLNFFLSSRAPADQPATAALYFDFYKSWIGEYLKDKDYFQVLFNFKRIADQVVSRQDANMAGAAGWAYFDKGDYGNALYWFERAMAWSKNADYAYGLAQTMRKLGNLDGATKLAEQWSDESDNMRVLQAELLLDRANQRYLTGDYVGSLKDAQASSALNPSMAADKLIAWSEYQTGQHALAAKHFESLYRQQPDKESADGLAASLQAMKQDKQFEQVATELGGPIKDNVDDMHAIRQFYRDQFILTDHTRKNVLPELKNIGTPSLSVMPYARHRSGESGLGQLDMTGIEIEARMAHGLHHFTASLDLINLRSGSPVNNALLGRNVNGLFNQFAVTPTTKESSLLEPMFGYRYEGPISPYIQIGTTPMGAEIGEALVGKVGIDIKTDTTHVTAEAFAENKQESILSTVGIVDPVSGESWGRVVEKGVRANLRQKINEKWSYNVGGQLSTLDGHNVADNDHLAAWVSAAYELDKKGFKYLTVGPAYRVDHYSDNRSFFTYGHGGYFSPDSFHRLSGEVNFQTNEAKQFVIKGRAALGYQYTDEADANALPLSNSGPIFTGGSDSGMAFDSQLSGVYRLSPWLQLGAFVNITQSPNFDDIGGGVFLRVNAFDRPSVFSSDLKDRPWND